MQRKKRDFHSKETNEEVQGPGQIKKIENVQQHSSVLQKNITFPTMKHFNCWKSDIFG